MQTVKELIEQLQKLPEDMPVNEDFTVTVYVSSVLNGDFLDFRNGDFNWEIEEYVTVYCKKCV